VPLADHIVTRRLELLAPDPRNPRLPARLADASDTELVTYLARHYDVLPLAESIANFGYFPSEPLVVIPKEPGRNPEDDPELPLIVSRAIADSPHSRGSSMRRYVEPCVHLHVGTHSRAWRSEGL
jgi:hypothetical protein